MHIGTKSFNLKVTDQKCFQLFKFSDFATSGESLKCSGEHWAVASAGLGTAPNRTECFSVHLVANTPSAIDALALKLAHMPSSGLNCRNFKVEMIYTVGYSRTNWSLL